MKKLISIGEALIDFIPFNKGEKLKDVLMFKKVAGGAPANVAGAVCKLGGEAYFLTKLGKDAFGDHIIEELNASGIDTTYVLQDEKFDTSLAFVSLASDGNRDFKFYRRTAADLQYSENELPLHILNEVGIIHFCSIDLVESPMKYAHIQLLEAAKKENIFVSFDPNLRLNLWDDHNALKNTINDFIQYADCLKISDDELEFITGKTDINLVLNDWFSKGVKVVIYTKGKAGATIYTQNCEVSVAGHQVEVKDTTGGGDSFIGAFLYCLLKFDLDLSKDQLEYYGEFANAYAAYTVTKEGALSAMADSAQFKTFFEIIKKNKKTYE